MRPRPAVIEAYTGYGGAERVVAGGRVLLDPRSRPLDAQASVWRNMREFARRMESDEVPGARVRATLGDAVQDVVADGEGHFRVEFAAPPGPHAEPPSIEFELLQPASAGRAARARAAVLLPPPSARFGVISDIDDTVLHSNVTRKLRMLWLLARSNAHTRKPFEGVAALYRALNAGCGGNEGNPIFYVSSSPWNLYPMLVEFLSLQAIPAGPLLLKDFGVHLLRQRGHGAHKGARIEEIFSACPSLPFVLIGDSGEQDPEIYADIVRRHPQRVRAVYIRSIDRRPARMAAIDALVAEVGKSGAQLVLAPDSEFAAVHAAGEGLIAASALADVRADKQADLQRN